MTQFDSIPDSDLGSRFEGGPGGSLDGVLDRGFDASAEDTLDLRLPPEPIVPRTTDAAAPVARCPDLASCAVSRADAGIGSGVRTECPGTDRTALLDDIGAWRTAETAHGTFRLVPVVLSRDLALISRWMNDPAVAAFWELSGDESVTRGHLAAQLCGDGRSVPCLGVLGDTPMSYWEVYRADLDPIARYYPARLQDTGIHLLIGGVADRGRGLGGGLLSTVAELILDHRPTCTRVVAEPDLRNTPSVAAFLTAGFRFSAEVELPGKRAALMIRERQPGSVG